MKDLYKILEVDRKASIDVIEKAYKVLAKKYHPDLQSTQELKKIAEENKKAEKTETPNYTDMTVSELRKLAKDKGVAGYSTMKKDELISSLN